MNYRELQRVLKEYRNQGIVARSFKLNQKGAILKAEYERVQPLLGQPQLPALTFGVEIEFISNLSRTEIAEKLRATGISARDESYNHRTTRHWKVIIDTSCGYEVVSPVLTGNAGLQELSTVLNVLTQVGRVNRSCGIHVHVGAEPLGLEKVKAIVKRWSRNEHHLDTIQPPSRRGTSNQFCQPTEYDFIYQPRNLQSLGWAAPSRYRKLNVESLQRHGTIEFRHHSGSLDAEKVTNWVKFVLNFCQETEEQNALDNGFESLFPPELLPYYRQRQAALAA